MLDNLEKLSLSELIETALQIMLAVTKKLPKDYQNPGTSALYAFRLLADTLQEKAQLSPEVKLFVKKIEEVSAKALVELEAKGKDAFIRPLVNQLLEYNGGYQRTDYSNEKKSEYLKSLQEAKLSDKGQLMYRKHDGRFYVLIDNGYRHVPQKNRGTNDYPKDEFPAHITINEGMKKADSEKVYEEYVKKHGTTENPSYCLKDAKDPNNFVYLNMAVSFAVIGAYSGSPKTNPSMLEGHQWQVEEKSLLDQLPGLRCEFKDYRYHITFAEVSRQAFSPLKNVESPLDSLKEDGASKKLKAIFLKGVSLGNDSKAEQSTQGRFFSSENSIETANNTSGLPLTAVSPKKS